MDLLDQEKYYKQRDLRMIERFEGKYKKALFTDVRTSQTGHGEYRVNGVVKYDLGAVSAVKPLYVQYWAAAPPNYMTSWSGSGMPFANETIAFDNSPSKGVAPLINGKYMFKVHYPNAYYTNLGTKYVPPSIHIRVVDELNQPLTPVHTIKMGNGIPFRSESTPDLNRGPEFYQNPQPIRSQWQILMESAYPSNNQQPENFWGGRTPQ